MLVAYEVYRLLERDEPRITNVRTDLVARKDDIIVQAATDTIGKFRFEEVDLFHILHKWIKRSPNILMNFATKVKTLRTRLGLLYRLTFDYRFVIVLRVLGAHSSGDG